MRIKCGQRAWLVGEKIAKSTNFRYVRLVATHLPHHQATAGQPPTDIIAFTNFPRFHHHLSFATMETSLEACRPTPCCGGSRPASNLDTGPSCNLDSAPLVGYQYPEPARYNQVLQANSTRHFSLKSPVNSFRFPSPNTTISRPCPSTPSIDLDVSTNLHRRLEYQTHISFYGSSQPRYSFSAYGPYFSNESSSRDISARSRFASYIPKVVCPPQLS